MSEPEIEDLTHSELDKNMFIMFTTISIMAETLEEISANVLKLTQTIEERLGRL